MFLVEVRSKERQIFFFFSTTMTFGFLSYISWSVCIEKCHSTARDHITFLSLLSNVFYICPNGSSFQTNHVIFYTPFRLNYCILLTQDLDSFQSFHTFYFYCFSWVLLIFAFILLVFRACYFAAIIKASVFIFKHPFLSHHTNHHLLYRLFTWWIMYIIVFV